MKRRILMKRVYNFSAGPSMLPEAVLIKAAEEMESAMNTAGDAGLADIPV
jgi:phosphoserine aminotransferase